MWAAVTQFIWCMRVREGSYEELTVKEPAIVRLGEKLRRGQYYGQRRECIWRPKVKRVASEEVHGIHGRLRQSETKYGRTKEINKGQKLAAGRCSDLHWRRATGGGGEGTDSGNKSERRVTWEDAVAVTQVVSEDDRDWGRDSH